MAAVTDLAGPYRGDAGYQVRTHGCQMNVHDSERISGLLEGPAMSVAEDDEADLVVFNTCAIRENADNKLYGNLTPGPGQVPQARNADRGRRLPGAEGQGHGAAQGTVGGRGVRHPQHRVAARAAGSCPAQRGRAGGDPDSLERFPSTLPAKRDSAYSGWVSVSVGCNNTCTFCIVPVCAARRSTGDRAMSWPRCRRSSIRVFWR